MTAIWKFDFLDLIQQYLVLCGLRKDPHNNFEELEALFTKFGNKPLYFFLFAKNTFYDRGVSTHNFSFRGLNKKIADLNSVSILASYVSQIQTKILSKECYQFKKLIHKKVDEVLFNYGLLCDASDHYTLLDQEIKMDYSMGYKDVVRYRASTAVPFYFYDLKNDIQTR